MKNNLLLEEEIEKIKRLSGLNEAAPGPNQAIAKLITTIQSTPLSDDVIREFEVLANGGKISINKSSKKITSIIWKDLSDDEVKLLFKSQEISDIFKKILNDNNIATDPTAIALYSPNLKKIIKGYEDAKNLPKISGGSSAGGGTTGTIPGPSNNNPHIGGDDFGNVDDLFKNTYKTSQAFQVFYHMIDNISKTVKLSSLDREKILLSWKQYGNHTPIQLEAEARKLIKTRQIEQYGWLKKLIAKGMEDPAKTIKIGGKTVLALSLWVPLAYAAGILGLFGIAQATVLKNWLNKNTNDPDVKDALLNSVNSGQTGGIGDIPQN